MNVQGYTKQEVEQIFIDWFLLVYAPLWFMITVSLFSFYPPIIGVLTGINLVLIIYYVFTVPKRDTLTNRTKRIRCFIPWLWLLKFPLLLAYNPWWEEVFLVSYFGKIFVLSAVPFAVVFVGLARKDFLMPLNFVSKKLAKLKLPSMPVIFPLSRQKKDTSILIIEKLEKLNNLRKEGVLSKEEFDKIAAPLKEKLG